MKSNVCPDPAGLKITMAGDAHDNAKKMAFVSFCLVAYVVSKFFGVYVPLPLVYAVVCVPFVWGSIFRPDANDPSNKIGQEAVPLTGLSYIQGGTSC